MDSGHSGSNASGGGSARHEAVPLPAGVIRGRDNLPGVLGPRAADGKDGPSARPTAWPLIDALRGYEREWLTGDVVAGLVVAIMLVPQAMAYAMLAGLPSHIGLYASLLPVLLYVLAGSSQVLAVGPVAIVSLMVAGALAPIAVPGSPDYLNLALLLAAMSGVIMLTLGIIQFGFVINFISQPVLIGFTTAAAIIISISQIPHLTGIRPVTSGSVIEIVRGLYERLGEFNPATAAVGAASLSLLLARQQIGTFFARIGLLRYAHAGTLARAMPLVTALLATVAMSVLGSTSALGVKVVGAVPSGMPTLALPNLDWPIMQQLLPAAFLIAIVGFLESVSVAKSLASKRRQRINPNQELAGLGMANLGAAITGGYPVAGSFSRSAVNFASGARTPVAALVTIVVMMIALQYLMPLLHDLPMAVLAAIIIMAAVQLVDFRALKRAWIYSRTEGTCGTATFAGVLAFGVVNGIMLGTALSLALHLWRTSRPHIAVVGQVGEGNVFRNVKRFETRTFRGILLLRIDESLYFANANYLEDAILRYVSDEQEIRHVVIVCTSVNLIDASALETFERLIRRLRDGGVTLHFAGMKLFLRDRLQRVEFESVLAPGMIFLSTEAAVRHLTGRP